ncbi:MAG: hypothetical protein J5589_09840 [Firmicutes bacterium]|nr:hypothetical protein [Bacillota bacterium]
MREFFMTICAPSIWCIVAAEILIAVFLFLQAKHHKQPVALCSGVLTIGLILDAAIIGLGKILPEGILFSISPARFVAHGLLIPLIFPICAYALKLKKGWLIVVWILTVVLMVGGLAQALATVLEKREIAGVVRLASGEETPKWADAISRVLSFGTVIPMMAVGIVVWIRQKNPHLFLSAFFMFAFSALGPATGNSDLIFFISMFGELLMVLFLYFFCIKSAIGSSKKE